MLQIVLALQTGLCYEHESLDYHLFSTFWECQRSQQVRVIHSGTPQVLNSVLTYFARLALRDSFTISPNAFLFLSPTIPQPLRALTPSAQYDRFKIGPELYWGSSKAHGSYSDPYGIARRDSIN